MEKPTAEYETITSDDNDDWKDDPQYHLPIAEIISRGGCMHQHGFQVAFISPFAGHVLGNAMQVPILRVEHLLQKVTELAAETAEFEEQLKALKYDLWKLSKSYQVREEG